MTDFLAGVDPRNLRLAPSILPDLLQLARIFRMRQLTEHIIKHICDMVANGTETSLLMALHLVASDWSLFLNRDTTFALLQVAAEHIGDILPTKFFHALPTAILVMLFSRCDIKIGSEAELAILILDWLTAAVHSDEDAEMLFSCVRTPFLSAQDREMIKQKSNGLPPNMIQTIEETLDSPRNHRCCLIRQHIERRYPRCGVPESPKYSQLQSINVVIENESSKVSRKGDENSSSANLSTAKGDGSREKVVKNKVCDGKKKSGRYYLCRSGRHKLHAKSRKDSREHRSHHSRRDHHNRRSCRVEKDDDNDDDDRDE